MLRITDIRRNLAVQLTVAALFSTLLSGCGQSEPAHFQLNVLTMAEKELSAEQRGQIATILEAMFGTPDDPFVLPDMGLELGKLQVAAGPVWSDQQGGKHGLYRRHCAHCHGISGDGAGPTAAFLNPYPRDYRQGKFKFKSTALAAKPTDADLRRILVAGIPGTAMPTFRLLTSDEIDALVEYVKYLGIRGEMETALAEFYFNELEPGETLSEEDATSRSLLVDELLANVVQSWADAGNQVIHPQPEALPGDERSPAEIARSVDLGRKLFYDAQKGNCIKCHGGGALGDGETSDFDDWNKSVMEFTKRIETARANLGKQEDPEQRQQLSRMLAMKEATVEELLPVRTIRPRNLRLDVYRGGRRPLDLYRRIHAGILGVPMPGLAGTLTPEEIWHVVDYVQSLPFEQASQPPQLEELKRERM